MRRHSPPSAAKTAFLKAVLLKAVLLKAVLPMFCALIVAFAVTAGPAVAQERVLPVVPRPQEVTWGEGGFVFDPAAVAIRGDTAGAPQAVTELRATAEAVAGVAPSGGPEALRSVWLGLPEGDRELDRMGRDAGVWPAPRIGEEGYVLHIETDRILVLAAAPAGLYYGVQTLKQLLRAAASDAGDGPPELPAVTVTDWPDLRWRGVMDDISRGPVPTPAYLKAQIRRLAEMKVNLFSHYVENVVATERHGDFAPAGGALTIEEWRELAAYAARHHVTLMGSFQSFGHFAQILAHPRYRPLGEGQSLLSPALEASYAFLDDVYGEMLPAFDAPFFNVNADETFDLGRGPSRARVDSLGAGVVYAEHIERLHGLLEPYPVRMMMWGDIALQHPEVLDRLPKDIVVATWNYDARERFDDQITPIVDAGFDVFVAPGVLNSYRMLPDFEEAHGNIRAFVRDGLAHDALGMLATVWDDGGQALFERDWYGVAYAADQAWRSDPADTSYDDRFGRGLYGDPRRVLPRALATLGELDDLTPTERMNEKVLWTQLVPERGQSIRLSLQGWDAVLDVVDRAAAILDEAPLPGHEGETQALRLTIDQYRYMAHSRVHLVAAAQAYRQAALLQPADRAAARPLLVEALEHAGAVHADLTALRLRFRTAWLTENRTYALDRVLDQFDAHLAALADLQDRLAAALSDFDQGHYLPSPSEVRIDLEETGGWYFRDWMLSGPIAARGRPAEDLAVDFLEAMGGEANAQPAVTQEFDYGGETYRWHRFTTPLFAVVDLAASYERNEDAVMYAHAMIDSPQDQRVRALVGSNDGVVVFLNGEKVFEQPVTRTLTVDEDEVWLPLHEGRNHLLLKISQGSAAWAFSFRLPDHEIRNSKNRYYIVD